MPKAEVDYWVGRIFKGMDFFAYNTQFKFWMAVFISVLQNN